MSGAVPPPPPPGAAPGKPAYPYDGAPGEEPREPTSPTPAQEPTQRTQAQPTVHAPVPQPPGGEPAAPVQAAGQPATPPSGQPPVPPQPATGPPHPTVPPQPMAPVQRVSAATRMPPAISPASQFSQAVTPAPARPGQPVVQSLHNHAQPQPQQPHEDASLQQYFPEQGGYAPAPSQYPPAQYAPQPGYGQQPYDPQYAGQYAPEPAAGYQPGYGAAPAGRKLTPGWIAFIAIDVALVVAALIFAVNLLGGPDETPGGNDPTGVASGGTAPATDGPAAPEPWAVPAGSAVFAAPSGNITCYITDDEARCGIFKLNNQPAPVDTCAGTVGYVATVDAQGNIGYPCIAADQQPQPAAADVQKLAYGQTTTVNGFTCSSADSGMTCVADATGRGFTIAKAGITGN